MSDAIREAFEALDELAGIAGDHPGMPGGITGLVGTIKSALQSQTAPAVPEWTNSQCLDFMAVALRHVVYSDEGDSPTCDDIRLGVKAAMLSAPQPDHSPDAGKVVQGKNRYGLDMGYFARLIAREFDDLSNFRPDEFARVCARMAATADASVLQEKEFRATPAADGGEVEPVGWHGKPDQPGRYEVRGFDDDGTVGLVSVALDDGELVCNLHDRSTAEVSEYGYLLSDIDDGFEWRTLHPAQPRNEVQAEALDELARHLNEQGNSMEEDGEEGVAQGIFYAASLVSNEAARLRASQQEGGEG